MKIDFANLQIQYLNYKKEIDLRIQNVLNKSNYILGEDVSLLENELEKFTKAKYAITCSSGTDALLLSLMAIDIQPGDEIITTPFSWISAAEMIVLLKAKPVFVDIEPDSFNIDANLIESALTNKTKAILPVSLFGQPPEISKITSIAKKHNLKVVIDGAQSFGSTYNGIKDSNLGDISITSFFPSKPLGCYGDGGAVFTNNHKYAEKIKLLRIHGQIKKNHHKFIGIGGRLDTIQAAILLAKLPFFSDELTSRQKISDQYKNGLKNTFQIPTIKENKTSSWAQYTIRVKNRDLFIKYLNKNNIPSSVFYPVPLHLQECFKDLNLHQKSFPVAEKASKEVLSIPMNPFLTNKQIEYIIKIMQEKKF